MRTIINDLVITIGCTEKLMPDPKYVISDEDMIAKIEQLYTKNITDSDGRTLLMYASLYERIKVVEWLLSKGEDVNCTDKMGNTALHFAVQSNCKEAVLLLTEHGANVIAKDNFGNSPIMRCSLTTPRDIFQLLIQRNADPHQKNNYGVCAMDIFQANDDVLQYLKGGQGDGLREP